MRINNYRFNKDFMRKLIGQKFNEYRHKKFTFNNSVSQNCYFKVNNINYEIFNDYQELDYLGIDDEATIWNIHEVKENNLLDNSDNCVFTINENIKSIDVIEDCLMMIKADEVQYKFYETRAIIFYFEDFEIAFEKDDCPFSFEIYIYKGHDLANKIYNNKTFASDYPNSDKSSMKLEREIIHLD